MSDSLDSGLAAGDNMSINAASKTFLLESAKWAKFLAVVGFIMIGLMMIVMLIAAATFDNVSRADVNMGPIVFMGLIMGAIYFFPTYFLYLFAKNIKEGLAVDDIDKVTVGFKNLKSMFLFVGVLTIIVLGIYLLMFVVGGAAGMMAGF